ncbi:hypothetical protein [Streptomyces sp. NPDC057623]
MTCLGLVQWDGRHVPFLARADCLDRLMYQAHPYFMQRHPAVA